MKKVIFLDAGHSELDPGASVPNDRYEYESQLNMVIRDFVVPELKLQDFKVIVIPDHKNLVESILNVNEKSSDINDGLALSIHCNKSPKGYKGSKNGAEAYCYKYNPFSRSIAQKFVDGFCKETGLNNRGAISDTQTFFRELGWIRKTNVWAILFECGYLDSFKDIDFIINNVDKVAKGIAKGVCAVYGITYKEKESPIVKSREEIIDKIKNLLDKLI